MHHEYPNWTKRSLASHTLHILKIEKGEMKAYLVEPRDKGFVEKYDIEKKPSYSKTFLHDHAFAVAA